MKLPKKYFRYVVSFLLLLTGYFIGFIQFNYKDIFSESGSNLQIRSNNGYSFTNPLIDCEMFNPEMISNLTATEQMVTEYISQSKSEEKVNEVAVYFRDLNQGRWFGINETKEFTPASLAKLPLVMSYLKKAESQPELLNKKILFKKDELTYHMIEGEDQYFSPSKKITDSQEYTIKELIEYSLVYSDNSAHFLLLDNIEKSYFDETIKDLDLYSTIINPQAVISPKGYGAIFRVLYNSTYLNQENSEWLLKLLSKSDFKDGIKKGSPDNIVVSNKFGEKGIIYNNPDPEMLGTISVLQLHDCGIIYYPDNPYFLCVMTEGGDYYLQEEVIQEISKIVYKGMSEDK